MIVAGGVNPLFTLLKSTTVLDLTTKEQREAGQMSERKAWFGMAVVDGLALAFGGMGPYKNAWGQVEEWREGEEEWGVMEGTMATAMSSFASLTVDVTEVCD